MVHVSVYIIHRGVNQSTQNVYKSGVYYIVAVWEWYCCILHRCSVRMALLYITALQCENGIVVYYIVAVWEWYCCILQRCSVRMAWYTQHVRHHVSRHVRISEMRERHTVTMLSVWRAASVLMDTSDMVGLASCLLICNASLIYCFI